MVKADTPQRAEAAPRPTTQPVLPVDTMMVAMLAVSTSFALVAPQGLTWLPGVLLAILVVGYRQDLSRATLVQWAGGLHQAWLPLGLFALWVLVRSVWAADVPVSIRASSAFLGTFFAVLACAVMVGAVNARGRWFWGYFPGVSLALASVLALLVTRQVDLSPLGGERLTREWHYNRAALLLVLLLPLALFSIGRMAQAVAIRRILGAVVVLATLATVMVSESESAKFALLATAITYGLLALDRTLARRLVLFGVLAMLAIMPAIIWAMAQNMHGPLLGGYKAGTFAERFKIWQGVLGYVGASPLWGNGVEFVRHAGHIDPETGRAMFHNHPHSFAMQSWVDLGALGVGLLGWSLAALMRPLKALSRPELGMLLPMTAATLAIWSVSHGMWQAWFVGLAGFAVIFAMIALRRARAEDGKPSENWLGR